MKKLRSISSLKKEADRIFSLWIRNRDGRCVTCGSTKNLQCGHFVSRSVNILRYDETNCHAQCLSCNVFKNGNMLEYAMFMVRTYGKSILEKLSKKRRQLHQFTRQELLDIIKKYKI